MQEARSMEWNELWLPTRKSRRSRGFNSANHHRNNNHCCDLHHDVGWFLILVGMELVRLAQFVGHHSDHRTLLGRHHGLSRLGEIRKVRKKFPKINVRIFFN